MLPHFLRIAGKMDKYVQTLFILGVNMLPQFLQIAGKINKLVQTYNLLEVGVNIMPHFLQRAGKMDKHILYTSKRRVHFLLLTLFCMLGGVHSLRLQCQVGGWSKILKLCKRL